MNIYHRLVLYFGSQSKAARALGVRQPSVNAWLSGRAKMASSTAIKAEKATNGEFKASDLCPELKFFENEKTASSN